jgi:hypothetical protein
MVDELEYRASYDVGIEENKDSNLNTQKGHETFGHAESLKGTMMTTL